MGVELDGANNIIKTDTISEVTSANGVTVDGVNIKDSKIVTANSVDSDVYVDGSIDTAHIADGQITIGKLATAVLTGATDIGAAIVDADLLLVDDGASGTLRKTTAARLKTYVGGFDVSSITGATALAAEPALTDEMVLSDAGTLKRLDMTHMMNVPAFHAFMSANQNFANNTGAAVEYDTERFDIGSCYNTTNYRFTPGVAGWYWIYAINFFASGADDGEEHSTLLAKNGTDITRYGYSTIQSARADATTMGTLNTIVYADADDYFTCNVWQNSGDTLALNKDYGSWGGFRITGTGVTAPSNGPPEN